MEKREHEKAEKYTNELFLCVAGVPRAAVPFGFLAKKTQKRRKKEEEKTAFRESESWTNQPECGIFDRIVNHYEGGGGMISQAQVQRTLLPWLGPSLLSALEPLSGDIAGRLNGFSIHRNADTLADDLDSLLFRAVRGVTDGSMLAQLPDGTFVRVQVEDFSVMADELMLLPFQEFRHDGEHLQFLRDYSLRHASLSALRVLYTAFGAQQSPQELDAIVSVVKSCYPAFRWREWLR